MTAKTPTIIGHTPCPICPAEAEVRLDKNSLAYIYCAHGCYTQVFTRDAHRDGLLRQRMKPMAAAVKAALDEMPPVPVPEPAARPTAAPTPAPTTAPASTGPSSWLKPLLLKDRK